MLNNTIGKTVGMLQGLTEKIINLKQKTDQNSLLNQDYTELNNKINNLSGMFDTTKYIFQISGSKYPEVNGKYYADYAAYDHMTYECPNCFQLNKLRYFRNKNNQNIILVYSNIFAGYITIENLQTSQYLYYGVKGNCQTVHTMKINQIQFKDAFTDEQQDFVITML